MLNNSTPINNKKITWVNHLKQELSKDYMKKINNFLIQEIYKKKIIFPEKKNIFLALKLTPLSKTKVIILGQDPYYIPKKAHGLAFSVPEKEEATESLKNIFKELKNNYPSTIITSGCLEKWAKQGVLLLNCILTVEQYKPTSHSNIGWEIFTDKIIEILNKEKNKLIFVLMGKYAQKKEYLIDKQKHYIIKTAHPSPLSAKKGFFGSKIFININKYLTYNKKKKINWNT